MTNREVTKKEKDYFKNCELLNALVLVKPEPVVASKIINLKAGAKQSFKNRGVVVALDKEIKNLKVGDVVVWSSYAVTYETEIPELVDMEDDYSGKFIGLSSQNIWYIDKNTYNEQKIKR